jgi:hypothetical protein
MGDYCTLVVELGDGSSCTVACLTDGILRGYAVKVVAPLREVEERVRGTASVRNRYSSNY